MVVSGARWIDGKSNSHRHINLAHVMMETYDESIWVKTFSKENLNFKRGVFMFSWPEVGSNFPTWHYRIPGDWKKVRRIPPRVPTRPRSLPPGGFVLKPALYVQGWAKDWFPGLVNCVPAVAYPFCPKLPAAFMQPGNGNLADLCTRLAKKIPLEWNLAESGPVVINHI